MANKKKIASKSKTKGSKYSKLMAAASKEMADKKKALAKAEKTLAAATKAHAELLQETARLDMLERSLKALVEGTEPPQNIKYVYNYPTWVWQPYYANWGGNNTIGNVMYTIGGQYTPTVTSGTFQGSQMSNLVTCNNAQTFNTVTTTESGATGTIASGSSLVGYNSSGIGEGFTLTASNAVAPFGGTQTGPGSTDLTIDLSTGAEEVSDEVTVEDFLRGPLWKTESND